MPKSKRKKSIDKLMPLVKEYGTFKEQIAENRDKINEIIDAVNALLKKAKLEAEEV